MLDTPINAIHFPINLNVYYVEEEYNAGTQSHNSYINGKYALLRRKTTKNKELSFNTRPKTEHKNEDELHMTFKPDTSYHLH